MSLFKLSKTLLQVYAAEAFFLNKTGKKGSTKSMTAPKITKVIGKPTFFANPPPTPRPMPWPMLVTDMRMANMDAAMAGLVYFMASAK